MGSSNRDSLVLSKSIILYVVLAATLCYADDGYICSRATYYGSPDCWGNPKGACGFGDYGRTVNNGVVSGVSKLYRNGSACGACYQVRCKISALCRDDGTKVVVTDYGQGHNTDFILSVDGYSNLAVSQNMAAELRGYGVVEVEYRRIPCRHEGYNLMLKIHERSSYPYYLAIVPIYQNGAYDITAAQVWVEDCNEWRGMRKEFGAVWGLENPPIGAAPKIRLQLTTGSGDDDQSVMWVEMPSVIPNYWKPGVAYDTGF